MQVFADAARAQLVSFTGNSLVVSSGARFPVANRGTAEDLPTNTWFKVVLAYGEDYEICYVKTHTGNGTFTNVERGKEGTTARTWAVDKQQTTAFIAPVAADVADILAALSTLQAAKLDAAAVGSAPNQVPSNQHLGQMAFQDTVGVTQLLQHTPDAIPGTTWKQVVGNSFEEKFVRPDGVVEDVTPLKLIQSFGLGTKNSPLITDLFSHRTGGIFRTDGAQAVAFGLPLNLQHLVLYIAGSSTANGVMFLTPTSASEVNSGRCWMRKLNSNAWQTPREISFTDSPAFTGTPSTPSLKFGNAASADVNTLDHYEEGTFTPTLQGVTSAGVNTYSNNRGFYTRIGDMVFWSAQFQLTSTSGMTGQLRMVGLPFNTFNNGGVRSAVNIGYYNALSDTAVYDLRAFHAANGSHVDFLKRSVGGTTTGAFPSTEITSNTQIYVSGHYKAA